MNRLRIDFAARVQRSPWPARALLGVAVALSLDAGLSYSRLRDAQDEHRQTIAQGAPAAMAVRKSAPEELAAVRETVDRLSMPWERLFGALEAAASEEVALLGIEPDAKAGTVLISGDSKDYLSALAYVLNLSRGDGLKRVQLVRHQVKEDDPRGAVSFAVSAGWSEVRQ
jgi:hypothetical protein